MKVVKILLIIVILLGLVGLVLPSSTHVERSAVINAPQPLVFSYLNDFKKFNEWSPWYRKDPDARYEFTGPAVGVGSRMAWDSEHEHVGKGAQEIVQARPFEYVQTLLDFGPQGTANASFTLNNANGATQIVWAFDTEHGWNLINRYFGLIMDGMIGPEYEAGLVNLKEVAEAAVAEAEAAEEAVEAEVEGEGE